MRQGGKGKELPSPVLWRILRRVSMQMKIMLEGLEAKLAHCMQLLFYVHIAFLADGQNCAV